MEDHAPPTDQQIQEINKRFRSFIDLYNYIQSVMVSTFSKR